MVDCRVIPRASELQDYLNSLPRNADGYILKSGFDPVDVGPLWSYLIMVAEEDDGSYRFTYVGRDVVRWSGVELVSKTLDVSSLGASESRRDVQARKTRAGRLGVGVVFLAEQTMGQFRQIMWPLVDEEAAHDISSE